MTQLLQEAHAKGLPATPGTLSTGTETTGGLGSAGGWARPRHDWGGQADWQGGCCDTLLVGVLTPASPESAQLPVTQAAKTSQAHSFTHTSTHSRPAALPAAGVALVKEFEDSLARCTSLYTDDQLARLAPHLVSWRG